jgi:uncharacterized phiE125 gp8 family phage protein
MPSILLTGPAAEPISLARAKEFLRVEHDADDDLIQSLIGAARGFIEADTRRALITQTWRLTFDCWPGIGRIEVRPAPLQSIAAALAYDSAGVEHEIDLQAFIADTAASAIAFAPWALTQLGRAAGIEIDVVVGFGDAPEDMPEPLRVTSVRSLSGRRRDRRLRQRAVESRCADRPNLRNRRPWLRDRKSPHRLKAGMTDNARLKLPAIEAAQAQKHVTHNEALALLDAFVQLAVESRSVTSPPGSPGAGDCYVVPSGTTGSWSGSDHSLALFSGSGWIELDPPAGTRAYVKDERQCIVFADGIWRAGVALTAHGGHATLRAKEEEITTSAAAPRSPLFSRGCKPYGVTFRTT